MRPQKGFTLPEVLISLLIFAMISGACVYSLRLGVDSRDQLVASDAELKELQIARLLIKEDFAQVINRPVRDEFGRLVPASFHGGKTGLFSRRNNDEEPLVAFVRSGWLNPNARSPRSALQYVEYVFKDKALLRRARVYLDDASRSESLERVLLDDLEAVRVEYLVGAARGELQWVNQWPVADNGSPAPRAIAITTIDINGEELRQLFWIGELGNA